MSIQHKRLKLHDVTMVETEENNSHHLQKEFQIVPRDYQVFRFDQSNLNSLLTDSSYLLFDLHHNLFRFNCPSMRSSAIASFTCRPIPAKRTFRCWSFVTSHRKSMDPFKAGNGPSSWLLPPVWYSNSANI